MTSEVRTTESVRPVRPTDSAINSTDIVPFNVRGEALHMKRDHVLRSPTLTQILATPLPAGHSYYFIDREPAAFRAATSYLRDLDCWTGFRSCGDLAAIWAEAIYLKVPQLIERVKEVIPENRPTVTIHLDPNEKGDIVIQYYGPEDTNMFSICSSHADTPITKREVGAFLAELIPAAESDGYQLANQMNIASIGTGVCYFFKYDKALHLDNLQRAMIYSKKSSGKDEKKEVPTPAAVAKTSRETSPANVESRETSPSRPISPKLDPNTRAFTPSGKNNRRR